MTAYRKADSTQSTDEYLSEPLDPSTPPHGGRFCDVVIEGGVINGVAYPSFLMELARRFHFHAVAGTSVGAVAAALAVACEYGRRFGSVDGYNEGLRKLPDELSQWMDTEKSITRIRSFFQPVTALKPLFGFAVDVIEQSAKGSDENKSKPTWWKKILEKWCAQSNFRKLIVWAFRYRHIFYRHFPAFPIRLRMGVLLCEMALIATLYYALWLGLIFLGFGLALVASGLVIAPFWQLMGQIEVLRATPGFGMCTGMPPQPGSDADEKLPALTEWVFKGVQDAAGLPYARPLTFADLWAAPGGPRDGHGKPAERSIDLRTITSCLNHGRIYELPALDKTARLFFRLSEFKAYFPKEVIDYLREVSKPVCVSQDPIFSQFKKRAQFLKSPAAYNFTAAEKNQLLAALVQSKWRLRQALRASEKDGVGQSRDIRELPGADLPIVIAARMSLSVPILFQAIPMLAFNLEVNAEEMTLDRLWFSDGGIGNNFPIQLFDRSFPNWPTFGVKVLEEHAKKFGSQGNKTSYVPYFYNRNSNDIIVVGAKQEVNKSMADVPSWSAFGAFLNGIYKTAKDGNNQALLRMPDVRSRVLRLYTDHATGNALNLKIQPEKIRQVAGYGLKGGRNLVASYLGQGNGTVGDRIDQWQEHRWIRFNTLVNSLRNYLDGFELAAQNNAFQISLFQQIALAHKAAPLQTPDHPDFPLTTSQANQLLQITQAIIRLERVLTALNLPLPYVPEPHPSLKGTAKI